MTKIANSKVRRKTSLPAFENMSPAEPILAIASDSNPMILSGQYVFLLDFFYFLTPINIAIVYVLISVSAMVEEQLPKAFIRSPSTLSVGGDQVWSKTKKKHRKLYFFHRFSNTQGYLNSRFFSKRS